MKEKLDWQELPPEYYKADVNVRLDKETRGRLRTRAAQLSEERGKYISMGQVVREMLDQAGNDSAPHER